MKKLIRSREEFVTFIASNEFDYCHMNFYWPDEYPVVVITTKNENHAYRNICAYFNYVYMSDFNPPECPVVSLVD